MRLAWILACLHLLGACSSGDFSGKGLLGEKADTPSEDTTVNEEDVPEDEYASTPIEVTGSFLVDLTCSDIDTYPDAFDPAIDTPIQCQVKDSNDSEIIVTKSYVSIVGKELTSRVFGDDTFAFLAPVNLDANLIRFDLVFTVDGKPGTLSTDLPGEQISPKLQNIGDPKFDQEEQLINDRIDFNGSSVPIPDVLVHFSDNDCPWSNVASSRSGIACNKQGAKFNGSGANTWFRLSPDPKVDTLLETEFTIALRFSPLELANGQIIADYRR